MLPLLVSTLKLIQKHCNKQPNQTTTNNELDTIFSNGTLVVKPPEPIAITIYTTLNNGYLGSRNDEERSKMRYVMWSAKPRESSNLWTQTAVVDSNTTTTHVWASFHYYSTACKCWSYRMPCSGCFFTKQTGWNTVGLKSNRGSPESIFDQPFYNTKFPQGKHCWLLNVALPSSVFLLLMTLCWDRYENTVNMYDKRSLTPPLLQFLKISNMCDYLLNLSISISRGKETNKDSLSNGEWSGKSSR